MKYIFVTFFLAFLATPLFSQIIVESPPPSKPPIGPTISGPTLICEGTETILKAEGDYEQFEWNNGVKDRFLKVKDPGVYEVTVKTKAGCTYTSSVVVRVMPCTE